MSERAAWSRMPPEKLDRLREMAGAYAAPQIAAALGVTPEQVRGTARRRGISLQLRADSPGAAYVRDQLRLKGAAAWRDPAKRAAMETARRARMVAQVNAGKPGHLRGEAWRAAHMATYEARRAEEAAGERLAAVRRLAGAVSTTEIAAQLGLTVGQVQGLARRHGIALRLRRVAAVRICSPRPPRPARPPRLPKPKPERVARPPRPKVAKLPRPRAPRPSRYTPVPIPPVRPSVLPYVRRFLVAGWGPRQVANLFDLQPRQVQALTVAERA